jgi:hypothetical protein
MQNIVIKNSGRMPETMRIYEEYRMLLRSSFALHIPLTIESSITGKIASKNQRSITDGIM